MSVAGPRQRGAGKGLDIALVTPSPRSVCIGLTHYPMGTEGTVQKILRNMCDFHKSRLYSILKMHVFCMQEKPP